ncbi:hypothetical protein HK102_012310 [Quaeritorhiza haematococci]|nr:hypothetical protein HK102_012310 [Quaeritorhiza haematococci]
MALLSKPANTVALVQAQVGPLVSTIKNYAVSSFVATKAILDKYPPIKAFVYTLGAASAVPVACFTGYGAVTLGGCLAVAGTGVTLVQGGIMAFGGFILFWFLAGALVLASIVTFWFTAAYFAFQVAKKIEG